MRLLIHGSTDYVTVQNWCTNSSNRTETIQAGNGQTLLNTQVDQLIQAMASFSQQTGLTWDQGVDQRPQDVQTVLTANWLAFYVRTSLKGERILLPFLSI